MYKSPIIVYYEAPLVINKTLGSGVEILLIDSKKKLVVHTERGEPLILGDLERCEFNPKRDTDGRREYYFA